jgi:hypothetical protein
MKMGRPTKLTDEVIEKAWDYYENYADYGDMIPSIVGLSVALKVHESTVYNWDNEKNPNFFGILSKIKEKQHQVLINKGLSGDFNAAITKLVLGKHGYHERQEQSGVDGKPIEHEWTVRLVDARDDATG